MRRFTIGSAMVLALLLMLTAIATAAPPNCEELPFEHPHYCGTPPSSTTSTTTAPEPSTLEPCETEISLDDLKPGRVGFECLWTPEDPGEIPPQGVQGKVTVALTEGISSLVVFVRDSSPGDICLLAQGAEDLTGDDGSFVGSFDLYYSEVPEFGDDDYSPWLAENYWDYGGTNWCAPQDPILDSIRDDLNGPPLHLQVGFLAKKNAGPVEVTLTVEAKPEPLQP